MEDWQEKPFLPVYSQLDVLTTALQGRLGFGDNFNAELRDLKVKTGIPTRLTLRTVKVPVGVLLVGPMRYYHAEIWSQISNQEVEITVHLATTPTLPGTAESKPSQFVDIRVLVIGA